MKMVYLLDVLMVEQRAVQLVAMREALMVASMVDQ